MNSLYKEEPDKELHSHLNYLLQLWRKSLRRQTYLKESISNLTNLTFADDVVLFNETTKQMEKHLNSLNSESLKVGLKIHKGKKKYMTNHADSEDILIDQQK